MKAPTPEISSVVGVAIGRYHPGLLTSASRLVRELDKEWLVRQWVLLVFAAIVFIAPALPGAVWAEGVVISSGKAGGYYDTVASRMRSVLNSQHGMFVDLLRSEGSIENLRRLDDMKSEVNLAFAQADALAHYTRDHPDFEKKYVVLAELGSECAFLIAPKKRGIKSASDLQAAGDRTVSVGDPMSGGAITYEHLSRLDPRFRMSPAENVGTIEALLDLKAKRPRLKVAAALVVQRPLAVSVPVEIVLENPSVYRFVPITESDLQIDAKAFERSGYSFEKITVGFGRDYRQSFETICTDGLILAAHDKLGEAMLTSVTKAFMDSRGYILPRSKK